MSARILRKKVPINYYEHEEAAFDEYVYCEKCADFVYEYCSMHGPLLVVPDEKVHKKPGMPSIVPHAALTIPRVFVHLAVSSIPGAGIGVFSTLTLPRGVRFGPYRGKNTKESDSNYCWQIYDKNHKPLHLVDAIDGNISNWMRYVNCARHWREQNLVAFQYRGELYYRTIKIIPKHTELLVYYGSKYARELQIDISKYNSEKYYYDVIIGKQPKKIPTIQTLEITPYNEIPLETNKGFEMNNNVQDNIKDDFEYIEEVTPNELITLHFDDNNDYFNKTQIDNEENANTNTDEEMRDVENEENSDVKVIEQKEKIKLEKEQTVYQCDICFKYKTTVRRNLLSHKNIHEKKFKCHFCEYQTNLEHTFDQHIGLHTKKYDFHCKECIYATNSKALFARHVRNVHKDKDAMFFFCPKCPYKCLTNIVFQSHLSRHDDKKTLKCNICHYLCRDMRSLKRHTLGIHKKET